MTYTSYIFLSTFPQHRFRETRMMTESKSSRFKSSISESAYASSSLWLLRNRIQSSNPLRNASIPLRLCILSVAFSAWTSSRPISNSQLHTLPCFHLCPIYLVFFKGSSSCDWRSYLEGGFTLRCLQRLSRPDLATLPCIW